MKKLFNHLNYRLLIMLTGLIAVLLTAFIPPVMAESSKPLVRFETSKGDFTLQLYPDEAPLTVANFLGYVTGGFYDGEDGNGATIFHRVIDGFMIQTGGFTEEFYTAANPGESGKTTLDPIQNEANNGLSNEAYTIAMARTGDPHSATSQFFINVVDNPYLDYVDEDNWGYAVFGGVLAGKNTVDVIRAVETTSATYYPYEDVPVDPVVINNTAILDNTVYFPHIASNGDWETEICMINTDSEELKGVLRAFDNSGQAVSDAVAVSLSSNGRQEVTVGDAFSNASDIGYITLQTDSDAAYGYTKFFKEGLRRVALPAVREINSGDIYIPHIASNTEWWTGIGLVNTGDTEKELEIEFNNGTVVTKTVPAHGHASFTIRDLFGGEAQGALESAVIREADGIIGLELFGSETGTGNNYLSGILLSGETGSEMIYPHIATNAEWWTGIVAYNPSDSACELKIRPVTENGIALPSQTITLGAHEKYVGTASGMGLSEDTAWLEFEATAGDAGCPVSGFELFGKNSGQQLGGYSTVGLDTTSGIFAKLEDEGWTGIAIVNPGFTRATVTLTAYNDSGEKIASEEISLNSRSKRAAEPGAIFTEDISGATYVRYTSDKEVVAFQLNGSDDDMLLDGLPGMSVEY
ncbi:peptidylprolyl isomerase [Desulfonema ishimotonii]|uniref:peptidylprolyl isomerase n=1 Tax=Desulfonema ishimotonii TaxID=45657 RepID=A0A401FY55_9BACT|nr:peptidylprolyl isomerase [Desulfonema ishimotonii]GBC61908.1 peptidylprolyl isomerase [Desulfonema ishimotonii]